MKYWPLNKCKKWLVPNHRHYPRILNKSYKMSYNSINCTIWQSILLVKEKLYEIAVTEHTKLSKKFLHAIGTTNLSWLSQVDSTHPDNLSSHSAYMCTCVLGTEKFYCACDRWMPHIFTIYHLKQQGISKASAWFTRITGGSSCWTEYLQREEYQPYSKRSSVTSTSDVGDYLLSTPIEEMATITLCAIRVYNPLLHWLQLVIYTQDKLKTSQILASSSTQY